MSNWIWIAGIIILTQVLQLLLISQNQSINPLLFVLPLDALMLGGLFWRINR
jgi:hypothetical protein